MKPAAWAVRPNQIMAKGIQARGGIGLISSTMGSNILSATRDQPIAIPMGRATRSPATMPIRKWTRLTGRSTQKIVGHWRTRASATWRKLGSFRGLSMAIARSCQTMTSPTTDRVSMPCSSSSSLALSVNFKLRSAPFPCLFFSSFF